MAYSSPWLEMIFLITVVVLWSMIFYQLFFTFMGLIYHARAQREKQRFDESSDPTLPPVSLLIPAHNEALVIRNTLASLCALEYPRDKMEILVINDGSTDDTAEVVAAFAETDKRIRLLNVPEKEAARGKPHALNFGLEHARHEILAVYDADNTPEPLSLRYLVLNLLADSNLASVFGQFRTRNRKRNLLTRFINLETLSFQFMIQAGRYLTLKTAILPGTNFLIRKSVLKKTGHWDEQALTEDTELSIRLFSAGYQIKFVPYSATWEEEPEHWRVWVRQRSRWIRGNIYILRKFFIPALRLRQWKIWLELVYIFLLYYLFLGSILLSHLFFITGALGLTAVLSPGPYLAVWVMAFLLFITEITLAIHLEHEASAENFGITALMYFTYCQGWIILMFRALYQEIIQKGRVHWEKTPRFATDDESNHGDKS
jgi:cellulose synthase/poly-beta-1,6-N-acetylglucosamine synthase-like glycosyltransferase